MTPAHRRSAGTTRTASPAPSSRALRGNNVIVYTDVDGNNTADGPGPDGGASLLFDYAWSAASAPSTYREAAATNAFYWANMAHDIFWRHGFTEAAGNMQANNYGRGGTGNDPLLVEIQDGSGVNNANGSSTLDGTSPRIQLYIWNSTTPNRDGAFDATTFLYAYGMVLNARIDGGNCSRQRRDHEQRLQRFLRGPADHVNFATATVRRAGSAPTCWVSRPPARVSASRRIRPVSH